VALNTIYQPNQPTLFEFEKDKSIIVKMMAYGLIDIDIFLTEFHRPEHNFIMK
jgi:hypothetical protein